jgi:hypothetical protein
VTFYLLFENKCKVLRTGYAFEKLLLKIQRQFYFPQLLILLLAFSINTKLYQFYCQAMLQSFWLCCFYYRLFLFYYFLFLLWLLWFATELSEDIAIIIAIFTFLFNNRLLNRFFFLLLLLFAFMSLPIWVLLGE